MGTNRTHLPARRGRPPTRKRRLRRWAAWSVGLGVGSACGSFGASSEWPRPKPASSRPASEFVPPAPSAPATTAPAHSVRIGSATTPPAPTPEQPDAEDLGAASTENVAGNESALASAEDVAGSESAPTEGEALGTFRNTYYNFPQELEFAANAPRVPLFGARCEPLAEVPREFHDSVCVQGSGQLASGRTVSFARRNCDCALVCPRTEQQICFDALDSRRFPWGRGATGKAITPVRSVAVDSRVIALGTRLYIPAFRGLPVALDRRRQPKGDAHDGCFVAEDRGSGVRGRHVDIFTGSTQLLKLWNRRVPTNQGVQVFAHSRECEP
jgi:3D (Asp-Asp-Asp) domain-containing protein